MAHVCVWDLQNRSCFDVNKIRDFCCHLKTDFGITPDFEGSLQHPGSCVHTRDRCLLERCKNFVRHISFALRWGIVCCSTFAYETS